MKWTGLVAAIGGALGLIGYYTDAITSWAVPLGTVAAVIFGIWAVNILWVALAPNESKYPQQRYSFGLSPIYNGDSFASVSFVMNVKLK